MTKLNIIYSPEFEVERLQYTLEKLDWYKAHGYKPSFPETLSEQNDVLSIEELTDIIKSEYDPSLYEAQKTFLESHWRLVLENSPSELNKLLPFLSSEYTIYLTRYGTGGSYDYPNSIYTNITYWWNTGIVQNILHEISHLSIHPLIEKHEINHWQKERIVDLITLRVSSKYGRTQKIKINVTIVDEIFEKFYPDVNMIINNIAEYNQKLDD